ncbi:hypothetical protein, partial [Escherichia coli]|uniref:hypothetical protein n=1 Tax=Escherichia coli TaxID=562 RepID=UPI002DF1B9C3|nr:hypothetical protein [Escherichia coli]MEC5086210.1 hypothetical protein [Escherichia coli]
RKSSTFFHHNDGGFPFFLMFFHKYLGWLVLLFNNITIHKLVNFPPGDFYSYKVRSLNVYTRCGNSYGATALSIS